MTTVLLTGATGLVGSRLLPRLAGAGFDCRALVRRDAGLPAGTTAVRGDLSDPVSLRTAVEGVDAVVHLAAFFRTDDEDAVFGFDFATSFCFKPPLTGIDFTRLQRAPEGSEHSAGCRSDDVIDGCRMRLFESGFVNAVVFGDGAMNAE